MSNFNFEKMKQFAKPVDTLEACNSIFGMAEKIGQPLTDDQRMVMAGAVSAWLDKSFNHGMATMGVKYAEALEKERQA